MILAPRLTMRAWFAVVLVFGLFAHPSFAHADASPSVTSDAYRDACQLATGPLQSLCVTLTQLSEQDHAGFGLESERSSYGPADSSPRVAVEVVARLVTTGKIRADAVTMAIAEALDPSGSARRYCMALRAEKSLLPGEAEVACIRPACLVSSDFSSIATYCSPLNESRRSAVLQVVRAILGSENASGFGCPRTDAASQICVGIEAAALVVKVDQMLVFFRDLQARSLPDLVSCKQGAQAKECGEAIMRLLQELGTAWTAGAVISESIRRFPNLSPLIDADRAFQNAWAPVATHIPTAEQMEESTSSTFPFDVEFVTALLGARSAIDAANARISARLSQIVINQFQSGKLIAEAVEKAQLPADLQTEFAKCRAAISEWGAKSVDAQKNDDVFRLASFIQARSACKAEAENVLYALARSYTKIESAQDCNAGGSATRIDQGYADYCFKTNPAQPGLAGLRLKFRPCLDLGERDCVTVSHLSILIRASGTPQPIIVDYPLGIKDIQTRISTTGVTVLSVPPQIAYSPPDPALIRQSLQRLLPPAFRITQIDDAKVDENLVVTIKGIRIKVAELELPSLCVVLGPKGTSFGIESSCQGGGRDIVSLAKAALVERLKTQSFALGGVPVSLHGVRMLANEKDKCPGDGIALGDVAIAALDQTLALCGTANIKLPNNQTVPVSVLWQQAKSDAPRWRLILDESKARIALQGMMPAGVNIETLSSLGATITARVTTPGGCRNTVEIEVTDKGVRTNVEKLAAELAACMLADVNMPKLPDSLTLFGITFSSEGGGRACAPIPGEAPVCISNVRISGGALVLDKAVLDDQGRLARYIQAKLGALLPGGKVTVHEVLPKLRAEVSIPALPPVLIELDAVVQRLEDAAIAAFRSAVSTAVVNKPIDAGPVTVVARSLVSDGDVRHLSLNVEIEYGSETVPTVLQVLPSLKLEAPSLAGTLAQAIKRIFGDIDLPNTKLDLITTPDGLPIIRCEVALPVIVDALKARGTIEWRPGRDSKPAFNGPVTLTWAGYTPIFAGVDIGNISGQFDYSKPGDISLSATLALTNGDTTSNLLRLSGTLSYNKQAKKITADTGLFLVNSRLTRSTTVVDLANFSVESQLAPEGLASNLPLPRSKVGIYGTACMASGKATVQLFNSVDLTEVAAVILLPKCASDLSLQHLKLAELDSKECSEVTKTGVLCVAAKMNVVSLFYARGFIRMPLGSFSPVLDISGHAFGADLGINASLKRIRVKAELSVLSVTIFLPTSAGIDAKTIEKILKNLLKPSIDLDSIRRGKIVISPEQGKAGDDEPPSTPSTGSKNDAAESGPEPATPTQPGSAQEGNHQAIPQTAKSPGGTSGVRLAFSSGTRQIRISKDRRLLENDLPYYVALIDAEGNRRSNRYYEVRVTEQTEAAMMGRGGNSLFIVPNASAFALPDGFYLLFCSSALCEPQDFVARRVELIGIDSPHDDLEKAVKLSFVQGQLNAYSYEAFTGALPRAAQLALGGGKPSQILCADYTAGDCLVALHRIEGEAAWRYFPLRNPNEDVVAPGSLWNRALQVLGPSQGGSVITHTSARDVVAIADNNSQLRVLLVPAWRGGIFLFVSKAQEVHSTAILTVAREFGYQVEAIQSSNLGGRAKRPWEEPPPASALSRILSAIPPETTGRKLTVNESPEGRRAVAEVVTGNDGAFIYAIRQRAQVCKAVTQTRGELGNTLALWAQPADLNDAIKGRLVKGTDMSKLQRVLATSLISEPFRAPFLADPLLLFYPSGYCQ